MSERSSSRRSKFDERPSEHSNGSRRRSASPTRRKEEAPETTGTPVIEATPPPAVSDAAAAAKKKAAEAAARISAMLKTKKASSPVVVAPVAPKRPLPPPGPPPEDTNERGQYVRDIEVNDLRNRYLVVKESTIEDIKEKTGADIEVRGKYYPDKHMATERDPPLFLHIASKVKTKMEAAVGMVNRLINSELGPLVDERRFRKKDDFERDELGRRKWPEERIYVNMVPIRGFHLRASIVGTAGSNVKFVQQETRTRIQIKGQGSGFEEVATGREADEPMYLHVTGPDVAELHRAKGMLEDLVESVRVKYNDYKNGGREPDRDSEARDSPGLQSYDTTVPPPSASIPAPPFSYTSSAPPPPPSMSYPPPGAMSYPPPGASMYPPPPGSSSISGPPPGLSAPPGMSIPPPPPPSASTYPPPPPSEYDPHAPASTYPPSPPPPGI